MLDRWHYTHDGRQREPLTLSGLQHLADTGKLLPTDLIWPETKDRETAIQAQAALNFPAARHGAEGTGPAAPARAPAAPRPLGTFDPTAVEPSGAPIPDWLGEVPPVVPQALRPPAVPAAGAIPDWLGDVRQAEQAAAPTPTPSSPAPARNIPVAEPVRADPPAPPRGVSPGVFVGGMVAALLLGGGLGAALVYGLLSGRIPASVARDFHQPQPNKPPADAAAPDVATAPPKSVEAAGDGGKPTPAAPPKNVLDVSYVAADFNAAAVLHPRRLTQLPLLANPTVKKLLADVTHQSGIDPSKVEQLIVLIDPSPRDKVLSRGSPLDPGKAWSEFGSPGFILRLTEPAGRQVLTKALRGLDAAAFQGKTYYRSPTIRWAGERLCGYLADDRTILIAPAPTLRKMLSAGAVQSPLLERLRQIDPEGEDSGVLVLEPYRLLLKELLKPAAAALPPELATLVTVSDQLTAVSFTLHLTGDALLTVSLEAADGASAVVLHELAGTGLDKVREVYPSLRERFLAQAPPALAKLLLPIADQLPSGVRVSQQGTHVLLTVKRPEGHGGVP